MTDDMPTPSADRTITFPDGIVGFPDVHSFALRDLDDDGTFQLLEALDAPDLSMVVCIPWLMFPEYAPDVDAESQAALGLAQPEDAIVFCSVTVDPEEDALYCNLLGPFVVNAKTLVGRQLVQHDLNLPVRASVPLAS